MSIQPNRVIARIVEQVDRSDWPPLVSRLHPVEDEAGWIRLYAVRDAARYATSLHFWVHALREDLAALGRREDLVAAASAALGQRQSPEDWRAELGGVSRPCVAPDARASIHRMLESVCRRSSVAVIHGWLIAHFRVHGGGASWRRAGLR